MVLCVYLSYTKCIDSREIEIQCSLRLQVTSWHPMPMLSRAAKEMHRPSLPGPAACPQGASVLTTFFRLFNRDKPVGGALEINHSNGWIRGVEMIWGFFVGRLAFGEIKRNKEKYKRTENFEQKS